MQHIQEENDCNKTDNVAIDLSKQKKLSWHKPHSLNQLKIVTIIVKAVYNIFSNTHYLYLISNIPVDFKS